MRWRMLVLLLVARIGLGFQFQSVGSVSGDLVAALGLTYTEIGTLIGLFMVPGMVLALVAGYLGRFVPDRFAVALGLLALAGGGGVAAVADGFGLIAMGRLICGIGFVVSTIFFTKLVVDWFAGREMATAMGVLVMSWPLGIALGQFSQGWIAAQFDWRWAFAAASLYCFVGGLLAALFCREAPTTVAPPSGLRFNLSRNEIVLTCLAALAWAFFNAGYVVYLGFAPKMLETGGFDTVSALATISLASWLMVFSGTAGGQVADRTGRPDLMLYVCMAAAAIALAMLFAPTLAVPSSLLFGLLGAAPAGIIMALTGGAMRPENRALGMGLFFSIYFLIQSPAPAIAGWMFDRSGEAGWPILFAIALFLATAGANLAFRMAQRRLLLT